MSRRISPTAHYTGYVWYRHGLSPAAFATREGAGMYHALRPLNALSALAGGPTLEAHLLARHRHIDQLLAAAIDAGDVGQVVEVACGLSPRGQRFAARYRDRGLLYLEGDLPEMAARKRALLESAGAGGDPDGRHRVIEVDAFATGGPGSLAEAGERWLDPDAGTAIVTEGLLGYFEVEDVARMWQGFAAFLGRFPRGLYLSDIQLEDDLRRVPWIRPFRAALAAFTGARTPAYFRDPGAAENRLRDVGFSRATIHLAGEDEGVDPRRTAWTRVVGAWT